MSLLLTNSVNYFFPINQEEHCMYKYNLLYILNVRYSIPKSDMLDTKNVFLPWLYMECVSLGLGWGGCRYRTSVLSSSCPIRGIVHLTHTVSEQIHCQSSLQSGAAAMWPAEQFHTLDNLCLVLPSQSRGPVTSLHSSQPWRLTSLHLIVRISLITGNFLSSFPAYNYESSCRFVFRCVWHLRNSLKGKYKYRGCHHINKCFLLFVSKYVSARIGHHQEILRNSQRETHCTRYNDSVESVT